VLSNIDRFRPQRARDPKKISFQAAGTPWINRAFISDLHENLTSRQDTIALRGTVLFFNGVSVAIAYQNSLNSAAKLSRDSSFRLKIDLDLEIHHVQKIHLPAYSEFLRFLSLRIQQSSCTSAPLVKQKIGGLIIIGFPGCK